MDLPGFVHALEPLDLCGTTVRLPSTSSIENSNGYTALRIAEERGYEDIANLLRVT